MTTLENIKNQANEALALAEKWSPIVGYPGYEISSLGSVRSLKMRNCSAVRLLKQILNHRGYYRVGLYNESGKRKDFFIHKLVLDAFVGRCPIGMQCAHCDGNRTNNVLANLAWKTKAENEADKKKHGRIRSRATHPMAKLTEADVAYIRKHYRRTSYHKSNRLELAKKFGVAHTYICNIVRNDSWKSKPS